MGLRHHRTIIMPAHSDRPTDAGPQQPILIVIAGPNGAGKTSLTQELRHHQWVDGCVYVNPDEIAQERFGDWNSPAAVLKAAQHAKRIREGCLESRQSLAFETVFSTDEKLSFVRRAIDRGFFVRLFYISTDSPRINAARILDRVDEGGHDVPSAKISSRYHKSRNNLREILPEVDRGYVYDNSVDYVRPILQFRTVRGVVRRVYAEGHRWADSVRSEVELCQHGQQSREALGGQSR